MGLGDPLSRASEEGRSEPAIGRPSQPDARHRHHARSVIDLEEDPVIAHADPVEPAVALHGLDAMRPRVLLEREEMGIETPSDGEREP